MNFLDMIKNSVLERFDGSGEFAACNAVGSAYLRITKLVQPLLHWLDGWMTRISGCG